MVFKSNICPICVTKGQTMTVNMSHYFFYMIYTITPFYNPTHDLRFMLMEIETHLNLTLTQMLYSSLPHQTN